MFVYWLVSRSLSRSHVIIVLTFDGRNLKDWGDDCDDSVLVFQSQLNALNVLLTVAAVGGLGSDH